MVYLHYSTPIFTTHYKLPIGFFCECNYNVLHLYTNKWCINIFTLCYTYFYNQSQPNTPHFVITTYYTYTQINGV